jgi:leader peptidase (prepilin peptidase)/N-methyltransferase
MHDALLVIGAAVLGLFAGAIVNARIMRSKDSMSFTTNRACAMCAAPVKSHEMLPVVGYLAVKGRCGKCKAVVPWQYPATEAAIAILFALFAARIIFAYQLPGFVTPDEYWLLFVRDALTTLVLVMVFMFDYRASVIPDRVTIPGMVIVLLCNIVLGMPIPELLLGGLLIGGFFAVQFLISSGRWVGGGDVRMGMLMGFLLGPILGIVALFISYVSGAAIGVLLLAFQRRKMNSHVPFGTFLALATFVCMFFGDKLFNWYLGLFS